MYTKKEYDDLLREIAKSGGDTPNMLKLMQKLRDDFDEREGMLKRYSESSDKREPEGTKVEEEKIREESRRDDREDGGERRRAYDGDTVSRREYEDLRRKYIDRFFSDPERFGDEKKKEDGDISFEDLFRD